MLKAIITDGFAVNPGDLSWEPISKICDLRVYEKLTDEEAAELIEDAEEAVEETAEKAKEAVKDTAQEAKAAVKKAAPKKKNNNGKKKKK